MLHWPTVNSEGGGRLRGTARNWESLFWFIVCSDCVRFPSSFFCSSDHWACWQLYVAHPQCIGGPPVWDCTCICVICFLVGLKGGSKKISIINLSDVAAAFLMVILAFYCSYNYRQKKGILVIMINAKNAQSEIQEYIFKRFLHWSFF